MKQSGLCCGLVVFGLLCAKAQDTFQLAPPFLKYASVFFEKKAIVSLQFAQPGTRIHYTTNGETPGENDPIYRRPIVIKKSATTLKAKVFGTGFLPSETVEATFYKSGLAIEQVIHDQPNDRYRGTGYATLTDGLGGIAEHGHPAWLGFQQDQVAIEVRLEKPQKIRQLLLHVLQNQGAWIFLPQRIEVFYLYQIPETKAFVWMGTKVLDASKMDGRVACQAIVVPLDGELKTDRLVVKIYPLAQIPEGHPAKGRPAWLFLDELKLY
ncbi:MAG: FN3 associated domain-containing protein [Saprospiraceae bacterium]|nr:FN3 associated domain-containing protein [Saprospiraceae bacterium]MDZ4705582.1 FN3 associated domain-containing protein [Saprospiraceae bacterium]